MWMATSSSWTLSIATSEAPSAMGIFTSTIAARFMLAAMLTAPLRAGPIPVRLDGGVDDAPGGSKTQKCSVVATNVSGKPIIGLVVTLRQRRSERPFLVHREIYAKKGEASWFAPNQNQEVKLRIGRSQNPRSFAAPQVDLVLFADGTVWGDDRQQNREYLQGVIAGVNAARQTNSRK